MSGQMLKVQSALDRGLSAYLTSVSAVYAARLALPNVAFDPNEEGDAHAGTTWFRAVLMPGEPSQLTMGGVNFGINQLVGAYHISCFLPKGAGSAAAVTMADAVASAFKRGLTFTSASVHVRIRRSWPSQGLEEDRWYHVPVTVLWWAEVENT